MEYLKQKFLSEKIDTKRKVFIDLAKGVSMILIMISHTGILNNTISNLFSGFYITVFFVCTGLTFKEEKLNSYKNLFKQIRKILLYYFITNAILIIVFAMYLALKKNFDFDFFMNSLI